MCGLFGIEFFSEIKNWDTVDGLEKFSKKLTSLNWRARYNPNRDLRVLVGWLDKSTFDSVENLIKKGNLLESKEILLDNLIIV